LTTDESEDSATGEDTAQTEEDTAQTEESPPESTPQRSSDCKKAPRALVKGLSTGVEGGVKLSDVYLLRSDDFERAYFVSGI